LEEQLIELIADTNPTRVLGRFQGKKLLVTGASKGIGLATALLLVREGAQVIRIARGKESLEKSRSLFREGQCHDFSVDATDADAVRTWVESCGISEISGAAFCAGAHMMRPARSSSAANYRAQFDANVVSVTNFLPFVIKNALDKSALVLVSSATVNRGAAVVGPYAASKAALLGLTRSLAAELAPRVRVNVVLPGVVSTEMTTKFFKNLGEANASAVSARHLLGVGNPDQVAAAITFLLSSDAEWITGAELVVDGGYSINA